ncbi:MAG: RraA family protein [Spirochaetaceae bacterium]|nr:RraA family protein [Spirochaetaceae bacterium]
MAAPPAEASLLDDLARIDTPTICNIVELFDVRSPAAGFMDGRIRCEYPDLPPMVGYAATATYRSGYAPAEGEACGPAELLETFESLPGPAVVVIQDLDEPPAAACFGDVSCSSYQAFGARGVVTSGAGRDLEQVQALRFPAFTAGTICSHGFSYLVDTGIPVQVGGITIRPGDLIHGDRNGVVTIPKAIAAQVATLADDFIAAEQEVLSYLQSARPPTVAGYRDAVGRMQRMQAEMKDRIAAGRG